MGVAAYVRKPFTPEKIRDVIDERDAGRGPRATSTRRCSTRSCSTVLERFAFMYAEPVPTRPTLPDPGEQLMLARDDVLGRARAARWRSRRPQALCREMAANVLGVDRDDPARARGGRRARRGRSTWRAGTSRRALEADAADRPRTAGRRRG